MMRVKFNPISMSNKNIQWHIEKSLRFSCEKYRRYINLTSLTFKLTYGYTQDVIQHSLDRYSAFHS